MPICWLFDTSTRCSTWNRNRSRRLIFDECSGLGGRYPPRLGGQERVQGDGGRQRDEIVHDRAGGDGRLAGPREAGCDQGDASPARMIISPRKPLNLQRSDKPATNPARQGRRRPPRPARPAPDSPPSPEDQTERRQHERLARDVGHRPVGVEPIKRIEHQQDRGDDSDPPVLDQNAAAKDRDDSRVLQAG